MSENLQHLLPTPPEEMNYRQHQIVLKQYPNGKPVIREFSSTIKRKDQETSPTKIEAFDTLGQEVFNWSGETINGSDGVSDTVTIESIERLPTVTMSRQVGTSFAEALANAVIEQLPEKAKVEDKRVLVDSEVQQILQLGTRVVPLSLEGKLRLDEFDKRKYGEEVETTKNFGDRTVIEYFYDELGRPLKQIESVDLSPYLGTKQEDKLVLFEKSERSFHYDIQGRLRMTSNFDLEEGQLKPRNAKVFQYENVNGNEVRVYEYSYSSIKWKDLNDGLYPHSMRVIVIDKNNWKETGYAIYEYADYREGDILTNYARLKRFPVKMEFRRKDPDPNIRSMNLESQPLQVSCPSWLTGADIYSIASGSDLSEVGTRADLEKQMDVYYLDEYVQNLRHLSDKESIEMVGKLLTGEARVNTLKLIEELKDFLPNLLTMTKMQRFGFASVLLSLIASQVGKGYLAPEQTSTIMNIATQMTVMSDAERKEFANDYRSNRPDLNYLETVGLWALESMEIFPYIVEENRDMLSGLLDN